MVDAESIEAFVLRHRGLFLAIVAGIIFLNWTYYVDTYRGLTSLILRLPLIGYAEGYFGSASVRLVVGKGLATFAMTAANICFSLAIVFVYFRGSRPKLKLGAKILVVYWLALFALQVFAYTAGLDWLFSSIRNAISYLSSPLVEAALIPLLMMDRPHRPDQ